MLWANGKEIRRERDDRGVKISRMRCCWLEYGVAPDMEV